MSIHEILSKDSAWHFIHQTQYGINYVYASNIQEDEVLSIIKYTMPVEIQKSIEDLITKYIEVKQDKKFTVKTINAITCGAVQLPLYIY